MQRGHLARLIFIALSLLVWPARGGADEAVNALLGRDQRLAQKLSLEDRFLSVPEAIARIGKATGVSLRTDDALRNENLMVFVRERPAAEILECMAQAVASRWYSVNSAQGTPRYELLVDRRLPANNPQARGRRRRRALQVLGLACREIRSAALLPPSALEKRRTEIAGQLADPDLGAERRTQLRMEQFALTVRPQSEQLGLLEVFERLLPTLSPPLEGSETIRLSSAGAPGMGPLPAWAAARLRSEHRAPELEARIQQAGAPPEVRYRCRIW